MFHQTAKSVTDVQTVRPIIIKRGQSKIIESFPNGIFVKLLGQRRTQLFHYGRKEHSVQFVFIERKNRF